MKEARGIFLLLGLVVILALIAPRFVEFMQKPQPMAPIPTPTPTPPPTPTPTPRPLTLAEMNALYGPCSYLPTLMYHHVQDLDIAKANNQLNLTVAPDTFRAHMEYLKTRGYTSIAPTELINFFDAGTPLPPKPILLTFDDAYENFGSVAAPIMRDYGFRAIVFVPTGLMENPGYLTWNKLSELTSWGMYAGNHTWSHKNVANGYDVDKKEIGTADTQLAERGLNSSKVFSYPYGFATSTAQQILQTLGYTIAFTTNPGSILCRGQRLTLPRMRIGNTSLSSYGL